MNYSRFLVGGLMILTELYKTLTTSAKFFKKSPRYVEEPV